MNRGGKKQKGKGPRVLANTIKKPETLNHSGNKSLNQSRNRYVDCLRTNNAKLAHFLALEKKKMAAFYQKYTESQAVIMAQKGLLRNISKAVKTGASKFKSALDLLIEFSSLLNTINDKIASFCPELVEENISSLQMSSTTSIAPSQVGLNSSSVSPLQSKSPVVSPLNSPQPTISTVKGGSQVRQCAAMPMVKGQIISRPTISLQRVSVPCLNMRRPAAGLGLAGFRTIVRNSGLSVVTEELDSSQNNASPNQSNSNSSTSATSLPVGLPSQTFTNRGSMPLPESHVLVERLPSSGSYNAPSLCHNTVDEINTEEDQLTEVHFGNVRHDDNRMDVNDVSVRKKSPRQPQKRAVNNQNSPDSARIAFNSSCSDEDISDTSSEDEGLQLQIVESKKHYLGSSRQSDSKEGTSWNYDDAGKFRAKPPRKKKSLKKESDVKILRSPRLDESPLPSKRARGRPVTLKKHPEKQCMDAKDPPDNNSSEQPVSSVESSLNNLQATENSLNCTVLDDVDMSFTECVKGPPKVDVRQVNPHNSEVNSVIETNEAKSSQIEDDRPDSNRIIHVTHRSRGRKPDNPNLLGIFVDEEPSRNNPLMMSKPKGVSETLTQDNIENSPPYPPKKSRSSPVFKTVPRARIGGSSSAHTAPDKSNKANVGMRDPEQRVRSADTVESQDLSHYPSYVVLERLPSNIMSGNYRTIPVASKGNDNIDKPKRERSLKREYDGNTDPQEAKTQVSLSPKPRKKRFLFVPSASSDENDSESENHYQESKYMPMPKKSSRSKEVKEKLKDKKKSGGSKSSGGSLALPEDACDANSAPVTPQPSYDETGLHSLESHDSEDAVQSHRLRRKAAPSSFKEPNLHTKLRRP